MSEQRLVYVGMSGGVDSSVSAALLLRAGYRVVGVYMKNWTQDLPGMPCPWKEDLADARRVAAQLGIELKVFDFEFNYREKVVDAMVAEYAAGRTPNPDVWCNEHVKFKLFFDVAIADGADYIATGHYAKVTPDGSLQMPADSTKDQTYFLYRAPAATLLQTLFPLGEMTKRQVRERAVELGLATARKRDSQGICFVGKIGIREFLQGRIKTTSGQVVRIGYGVVGEHDGAVYYTLGQRQGLGLGGPDGPFYVVGKDMHRNIVYVSNDRRDLLLSDGAITIDGCSWLGGQPLDGARVQVRLRHLGALLPAQVKIAEGQVTVELDDRSEAIAAGQSVVLYDGAMVLGGGYAADPRLSVARDLVH